MIYKTLKKVSEYCQILDKSKYNPSQTINGVTFTNNWDGTFTANGTAIANIDYRGVPYKSKQNMKSGHKYLLSGCPAGGGSNTYYFHLPFIGVDKGNGIITELTDNDVNYYDTQMRVNAGTVCDNLVFKPQLFDLTEMYGAGNEPTTVEEFREKFPNELYDYKPYCFVPSYKNYLKVSDYCQLLDKSKFPATRTTNGITCTNNGDGSLTLDGTSTAEMWIWLYSLYDSLSISHKYLLTGGASGQVLFVENRNKDNGILAPLHNNTIVQLPAGTKKSTLLYYVASGITLNNVVIKPQLFDLTERYGSGNEPTTVEEFKADFPNDLYDYKPYCFVPSYKKSLRCTTKNLFDKSLVKMPNDLGQGTSIDTTNNGWIVQGGKGTGTGWNGPGTAAWVNGWFRPGYAAYTNNKKGIMLKGGDTVRVSAYYTILEDNIAGAAYDDIYVALGGPKTYNGYVYNFHPAVGVKTRISRTITIENGYDGAYYPTFSLNSCKVLIEDIQIEYGTTTTEYHPYGYL